ANRPVAAVFNQLGFERQRHLVHIDSGHLQGIETLDRLADQQAVQYACEEDSTGNPCAQRGLLFLASAPSMGFQTFDLEDLHAVPARQSVRLVNNCTARQELVYDAETLPIDYHDKSIGFLNDQMCVEIAEDDSEGWTLQQVLDLRHGPQGTNIFAANG